MTKLSALMGRAVVLALCCFATSTVRADDPPKLREVGVAKIDITPNVPIRLMGYYGRNAEATNAAQHLFAKALAIGEDGDAAVIITIDNCIIPWGVRQEVLARLNKKAHLPAERVAICASHTHTGPCLSGAAPDLFGMDFPAADQAHIDAYTREFVDKVEKVALAALKDRLPANLSWGQTKAFFAMNRRTKGGPVDDDLPYLMVTDAHGKLRAILANYACHCTTLGGNFIQFCGDWAGYAQEYLEKDHPGVIVLTAIGCAADANPGPRGTLDLAKKHGQEFADAVNAALGHTGFALNGALECRLKQITLPFDTPPTRAEWEKLAKTNGAIAYHARKNLARLDRGEELETEIPYPVQVWNFGNDLAMVFLPGEVVVDYSIRLKKEFDSSRLWVNAYSGYVPCYIPSTRILKEGGYEGGGAMVYYDHPAKLGPDTEERILYGVHEIMPANFIETEKTAAFPPAKSPVESMDQIQTKGGLKIELVASEPLIESPVYIDFGPDGKMWVVEMRDYPMGMDGNWKPGGRIKYLESTHHDGHYDKATLFMDNLPFPTGVMPWNGGALVCAAPDIVFGKSTRAATDKNQLADSVTKVFSGFYTDNYQARVNGLSYGLDNWIYGANGLLGGVIHGMVNGKEIDIRGRDFRMSTDLKTFEPVSGLTQQGRVRDDWGNWFGCDNSNPLWDYPLPDHYIRRNPYVSAPSPRIYAATGAEPGRVYPISHMLERFNHPESANTVTSGCGVGIYRDNVLGEEYAGNSFTCEPVGNLVYRLKLSELPDGAEVKGARVEDEQSSDFLASRDNWTRPVQVKTGPDGALYIVDMYRFVIEHPRWIGKDRLAQLDVRAGANMGRIYRVVPSDKPLRPVENLAKLSTAKLVAALDIPNGTVRDLVQIELIHRNDAAAVQPLTELAAKSKSPAVRIQALCALDGMKADIAVMTASLRRALADPDKHVRRQAIRLSETYLTMENSFNRPSWIQDAVLKLTGDPDVRYQLALSLGEWNDPSAGKALGEIARAGMGDSWIRAAVLSSAVHQPVEILKGVLTAAPNAAGRSETVDQLIATAVGQGDPEMLAQTLAAVVPASGGNIEEWQFSVLKSLLDALDRKKISLDSFATAKNEQTREAATRIPPMFAAARILAADKSAKESARVTAIRLLGHETGHQDEDLQLLGGLLAPGNSMPVQKAAVDRLKYEHSAQVPGLLLANWRQLSPSLRTPILEILLSREEFIPGLLTAVQKKTVSAGEITAAQRQRLLKDPNEAIRKQAAEALNIGATSSRAEAMAKYQVATKLAGDVANGRTVFTKNCTPCHRVKGQGFAVGPNLAALVDKTPDDFLLAIIDPNAAVEPRFLAYNIETKDDRSLTGVISAETATSLTLMQPGGLAEKILRSDVSEIKATGLSLMPEGFEQAITPQELADLIAYLRTSPAPFGSASAEKASAARARFLAEGPDGVARLLSASEEINYPSWMGALPLEHCRQTDGKSHVSWQTAPVADGLRPDGSHRFRLPASMGWISATAGKFHLNVNGKHALDFDVALDDKTWTSSDGRVTMSYTVMENNAEDSNGILVIDVPDSCLEAGKPVVFDVIGSAADSQRWFGVYLASGTK